MRTLVTIWKCSLLLLAINHVLQNLWHFEILALESLGEPKMWNISKMAGHRAKQIIDRRAKIKLWHFKFILNTGPYATSNFKVLFLPSVSL